jgi:hypothetical protein
MRNAQRVEHEMTVGQQDNEDNEKELSLLHDLFFEVSFFPEFKLTGRFLISFLVLKTLSATIFEFFGEKNVILASPFHSFSCSNYF